MLQDKTIQYIKIAVEYKEMRYLIAHPATYTLSIKHPSINKIKSTMHMLIA
jgi:hypothetical protein